MSKRRQPAASTAVTEPALVGEGRDIALDAASATAIARASEKAGFPVPPPAADALHLGLDLSKSPDLVPPAEPTNPETPADSGAPEQQED